MRCSLFNYSPITFSELPGVLTPIKWKAILIVFAMVVFREGLIVAKSLFGRCSIDQDIIIPLKKKTQDTEQLSKIKFKFIEIGSATLSLNCGFLEKMLKSRGNLQLKGSIDNIEINYIYGRIIKKLEGEELNKIRRLIFPTREEVLSLFKEAIMNMSKEAIEVNHVSCKKTLTPQQSKLRFPGGGDAHIFITQTSDGRIWSLSQGYSSNSYYLTQHVPLGGWTTSEVYRVFQQGPFQVSLAEEEEIAGLITQKLSS